MEPAARFGRFELVGPLGSGGMAEVFLARAGGAARVQKTVVLKRLRPEQTEDEAARARFVEEARVAVSLSHPHLVPVFEFGEQDGRYFLVMEWVRGGELARVAGVDRAPLGWAAAALCGSQLCDALAYVHARKDRRGAGLVHGDVTPRNVLLSRDGHALLGDFGLARFAPRGRAGTRRFLAPEQARGEPSDGRADLYALALVLTEAATGQPAYDRDPERAEKQARVGLAPVLDGVDEGLAALLKRALAPSAESRFADAAAMRDAFESLLDREPRARATGRAELIARVAVSREDAPPSPESRLDPSALATREATRAPRSRSLVLPLLAAAIAGALGLTLLTRIAPTKPAPKIEAPPPPRVEAPLPPKVEAPATAKVEAPAPPKAEVPAPVAAKPSPHAPRKPTATAPAAPATLDLNAVPWAHVRIDGADRGETPLLGLSLPPGPHRIELANEPLGVRRELRLDLPPAGHVERVVDLTKD
jgi:serine/threonine-protein kinase